ncbi:Ig-like domain-containing protein [Candidatus Bipolaricaulota bacterium]
MAVHDDRLRSKRVRCVAGGLLIGCLASVLVGTVVLGQGTWGCIWGCQAQDVTVTRVYLADITGTEFPTCTSGSTLTNAYIWADISTSNRYAAWAHFDLWVGGVPSAPVDACFADTLSTGSYRVYGPMSWTCGDSVTLINLVISYEVNQPSTVGCPGDDFGCLGQRTTKCSGPIPTITVETPTPEADLAITKTVDTDPAEVGGSVVFTLSVTNSGPDAASDVIVTDTLPAGLSGAEVSVNGGAWNPYAGSVSLGTLANGASSQVRIRATVDCLIGCNTSLTNSATVSSSTDDPSSGNNSSTEGLTVQDNTLSASNDTFVVTQGEPTLLDVIANDLHPCYSSGQLTLTLASLPSHGQAQIAGGEVKYTSNAGFVGADSFAYRIEDPCGQSDQGTAQVTVERGNVPPNADANGIYLGVVGESILLDARFSHDPDITDVLQYRWDIDNNGEWDTEWLSQPTLEFVFSRPYRGMITVEVRDLYLGTPNGTADQATTFARIEPKPTQIAVSVYVDLNGNGEFDEGDVGLPGVSLLLDGDIEMITAEDGTAILNDATPGTHTIRISEAGVLYLAERGFFLSEEALASVELQAGEWIALFFNPEARGFLEVDLGADDEGSEDGD